MITGILLSMNNHGWGNNPEPGDNKGDRQKPGNNNQGPPDLEEVWGDVTRRLRNLFGGKSGGPGGGFGGNRPNLNARQFGGGVGIILGLIVLVWLASGFYIVDEGERGIVLRFGRYSETTESGLRWHLPYPFESNEIVNVSNVRRLEIGYRGSEKDQVLPEALMLTEDLNIVNIQFAVQYLLKDPQKYLFNNRSPDDAVKQAAETAIREMIGKNKMDYVLSARRAEITEGTRVLMQKILDVYETGIEITSVTMQKAQQPVQVQAAFDDVVKAENDGKRSINDGEAYANDIIPRAKGTASRLLAEADGYKQRVISTAEGDASRFKQVLAEYVKAPEVTRNRLYIETMQQIYSSTTKVLVDTKGQGNLLYLPLDKLIAASAVASASSPANPLDAAQVRPGSQGGLQYDVPPQVEKTPPVESGSFGSSSSDARRRDNLRSRDRGAH